MLNYDVLIKRRFPEIVQSYAARDAILYALGLGLGADPLDPHHLRATYEGADGFGALPGMVNVLAYPGFWAKEADSGLTWQHVLHGEQSITLHKPLPASGTFIGRTRITEIIDKGKGRGALVRTERDLTDQRTSKLVATVSSTLFARADGGFEGPSGPSARPHPVPDTPAPLHLDFPTAPNQALVYRLSGDNNPLHADPEVARQAGFERPILHGLCSFGIASWAVTRLLCDGDFTRLRHLQLRFTAPVFPGETIRTELWPLESGIALRARVLERDIVVLSNGLARIA